LWFSAPSRWKRGHRSRGPLCLDEELNRAPTGRRRSGRRSAHIDLERRDCRRGGQAPRPAVSRSGSQRHRCSTRLAGRRGAHDSHREPDLFPGPNQDRRTRVDLQDLRGRLGSSRTARDGSRSKDRQHPPQGGGPNQGDQYPPSRSHRAPPREGPREGPTSAGRCLGPGGSPSRVASLRGSNVCLHHRDRGFRPLRRGFRETGVTSSI
jgi:hypothetical protein